MNQPEVLKRLTDSRALLELSNSSGKYRWWMVLDHLRVIGDDIQTPTPIREHASAIHKAMQSRDATRWTRWDVAKVEISSIIEAVKGLDEDAWVVEVEGETSDVPESPAEDESMSSSVPAGSPQTSPDPHSEFSFAKAAFATASDPPPLRGRGRGDRR